MDKGPEREYVLYLFVEMYRQLACNVCFDNPITGNRISDKGAKHLKLPGNLQTLDLCGK